MKPESAASRPIRPRLVRLAVALFVVLLIATACSVDGDEATSGGADSDFDATTTSAAADRADAGDEMAEGQAAVETTGAGDSDSDGDASAAPGDNADDGALGSGSVAQEGELTAAQLGREIIFTAEIAIDVDDVAAAEAQAVEVINGVGGFVFGQNTTGGNNARSEITFKVLPSRFDEALRRLGDIGELRNQSIFTDDVTERVVNLESRIEVAELGVERLRGALENATGLEDYAEIERLLLNRESDLEVMRGQLRTIRDQVDLATITLILTQDVVSNSISLSVTAYEGHDQGLSCPGSSDLRAEADTEVTICYEVTNTGDQTLTNVTITDTVLGINADSQSQLIAVFDDISELAPLQSAIVAWEITPERTIRSRTRVSAIPTDGVSPDAVGPAVNTTESFEVRTFTVEPDEDPGFTDGFDAAKNLLLGIWVVITVAAGFLLLPLLIGIPLLWLAWKVLKPRYDLRKAEHEARMRARIEASRASHEYIPQPTPPPPSSEQSVDAD